jgi:hypothetical protein
MEQSPSWEAKRFPASQGIPRTLWKPKVHYSIRNSALPVRILRQIHPVHTPHSTSWRSTLILSSHLHLGLLSGPFPLGFPNPYVHILSPICATYLTHLILLDLITRLFDILVLLLVAWKLSKVVSFSFTPFEQETRSNERCGHVLL